MITCLNNATTRAKGLAQFLQVAHAAGFEAVEVGFSELESEACQGSAEGLQQELARLGLRLASAGLPVRWQGSEAELAADMSELGHKLELGRRLGLDRVCTWIPPRWDRPYAEVLAFCRERLAAIADALGQYGYRLGLEFVAPQGNFLERPYKFVSTLAEAMHLIGRIGRPNVGLLLDSYHLFVAGAREDEISSLPRELIVHLHVNDALPCVPREELEDLRRLLPGKGAIPLVPMLRAVMKTGYDGAISVETFSEELWALGPEGAAQQAKQALDAILAAL